MEAMEELAFRPATRLVAAIAAGELSSRELVDHYLDRIEEFDGDLHAVVTLDADRARQAAAEADAAVAAGEPLGPLHGLPVTVKDVLETAGLRTTCGATPLRDHIPAQDAVAVARLRAAGAIVLGKTNVPAWAADSQTYNDLFGTTVNPWDAARTPGGSSGGAAAAVAAGLTGLEVGSDLGGSLRLPAHWCGVFSLKPSYGVIPTRGHIPPPPGALSPVDVGVVGPIARSAEDLDLALRVLAGPDDAESVAWHLRLPDPPRREPRDWRVAVWADEPGWDVDSLVAHRIRATACALAAQGFPVEILRPSDLDPALDLGTCLDLAQRITQAVVSPAFPDPDFAALAARAAAAPGDPAPAARFARNVTARARDLMLAREEQARVRVAWRRFFDRYDVLLSPPSRSTAIPHDHDPDVDARVIRVNGRTVPYGDQFAWVQAVGVALLPAAVVPLGLAADGLPAGVQVVGPYLHDRTVLDFARALSDLTGGFSPPPAFAREASRSGAGRTSAEVPALDGGPAG